MFNGRTHLVPDRYPHLLTWLRDLDGEKNLLIRPEVYDKIERHFNQRALQRLADTEKIDFTPVKLELFPYQQEGVRFAAFKSGCIIADEMGLGKTAQAIVAAVNKKRLFDFKRTLIVCPATLKQQWQKEIDRFTGEKAEIIQGSRPERLEQYRQSDAFFLIINYEALLRDILELKKYPPDFMILDEAQRIKNYATKTANAVKAIPKKHSLVITGTPIENRLIDLYSITQFVDPELLSPLWEFSMNHCYFDKNKKNKITGYYNLQALKEKMKRRPAPARKAGGAAAAAADPGNDSADSAGAGTGRDARRVRPIALRAIVNKKHLNFLRSAAHSANPGLHAHGVRFNLSHRQGNQHLAQAGRAAGYPAGTAGHPARQKENPAFFRMENHAASDRQSAAQTRHRFCHAQR